MCSVFTLLLCTVLYHVHKRKWTKGKGATWAPVTRDPWRDATVPVLRVRLLRKRVGRGNLEVRYNYCTGALSTVSTAVEGGVKDMDFLVDYSRGLIVWNNIIIKVFVNCTWTTCTPIYPTTQYWYDRVSFIQKVSSVPNLGVTYDPEIRCLERFFMI